MKDNIFTSCRKGDISRVKYLVEQQEIDLNIRDCWDSTPLYYACLCGHIEVVKYLLDNGARCEANTFDGERCFYGALTQEIKMVLLDAKILTSNIKRRDDYYEFCERLLRCEEYSDVNFRLQEKHMYQLHRCILSARSEHFRQAMQFKWKDKEFRTNIVPPTVFESFLRYIYTSRTTCNKEYIGELMLMADKCKLSSLKARLEVAIADAEFIELTKKGRISVNTIVIDAATDLKDLQQDFTFLIEAGIPSEFSRWPPHLTLPMMPSLPESYFDMCLIVEGHSFYCHKLFLCTRSGYFHALAQNHFEESPHQDGKIQRFELKNVSANVITCVLYFIYTNSASLNEDTIYEVLEASDMYLLPGLTRSCANFLCGILSLENVIPILKLARYYKVARLEDRCAEVIGDNIHTFEEDEEFHQLVIADSEEVKGREDTDSIEIIDDIRYQITSKIQNFSAIQEANEKLQIINNILDKLGLEA